ncbi:MAG: hypothetical protein JWO29_1310 [Arthrobacter sp.]|nr:hypothetical protein [Arthrobacter sp.]
MKKLKAISTAGTIGLLAAGTLVFGSAQESSAATCKPSTLAPSNSYPGTSVVTSTFESGKLSPLVSKVSGNGTAAVTSPLGRTGSCSAKLHVTSDSRSLANLSTPTLPSGTKTVYADGWFNITTTGATGSNVPYFRFFSGSTRVADIYRYNNNGQLWLRVTAPSGGFVYTKLIAGSITLNAWHRVAMRVTTKGSTSTIQVWFDGVRKYSSSAVSMNATSLSKVQLGAEHYRQKGDSYIDNVIIKHS